MVIVNLNLTYINWWWQLGCKDGWTPDSIIKFGCDANMRSINGEKMCKICVGSFVAWCNPNCDVTFSNAFPWEVVLSSQYQIFDFALKSPITTRRKKCFETKLLNLIQSYQQTFQNCPAIG